MQTRMRGRIERGLRSQLSTEFRRLVRSVRLDIHSIEPALTQHQHRLERILSKVYRLIFTDFGGRALARLKAKGSKSEAEHEIECKAVVEDTYSSAVEKFTKKWTARKASQITATSRAKIERIVREGVSTSMTDREVADKIQERVGGAMGDRRALTIARTETHSASQDAAFELIQTTGLDATKEWVAVEDARTREDHSDANGQEVDMHERFTVGDDELMYPGDPSGSPDEIINCRCICVFNTSGSV